MKKNIYVQPNIMSVQLLLKTTILQAQSVEVDPNQSGSQSGAESLNVDFEDEGQ